MQISLSRIKTSVSFNRQLKQNIISNDSNDSMYCPNRTCNVSLVKTQNQIDAAAAQRASALLLYQRDARRAEKRWCTHGTSACWPTRGWIRQTSHISHFPPLHFCPSFSSLAFSVAPSQARNMHSEQKCRRQKQLAEEFVMNLLLPATDQKRRKRRVKSQHA